MSYRTTDIIGGVVDQSLVARATAGDGKLRIIGFDLRGTDGPGRIFSHFYATYKPFQAVFWSNWATCFLPHKARKRKIRMRTE